MFWPPECFCCALFTFSAIKTWKLYNFFLTQPVELFRNWNKWESCRAWQGINTRELHAHSHNSTQIHAHTLTPTPHTPFLGLRSVWLRVPTQGFLVKTPWFWCDSAWLLQQLIVDMQEHIIVTAKVLINTLIYVSLTFTGKNIVL